MHGYYSIQNGSRLADALGEAAEANACCQIFFGDEPAPFPENHFVCEDAVRLTACCGYVLNDVQLANGAGSFSDYLMKVDADEPLAMKLRGSYAAAVYDKGARRLQLTNDLLAKQPLYYWEKAGELLFSTRFDALARAVKKLGETLTPEPMAVAMMVETGFLWEDFTYAREIRYLSAFCYLRADATGVKLSRLPVPTVDEQKTQDEAILRIDALFTEAVRLQYEKNARAGYAQLGSLSGGMDARNVLVAADRLGYTDDMTFTYSESGSFDMSIAQQVARHFHCPNLFYSMDGGDFLRRREDYAKNNEGELIYCGATGLLPLTSLVNLSTYGLIHTGIAGGEIMGDIIPIEGDTPAGDFHMDLLLKQLNCPDAAGVERLKRARAAYPSFNAFRQVNDVRANTNFARTLSTRAYACSPFLYEDFFLYMMQLPIAMKGFRKLYYAWVNRYQKLPYRTTDASLPRLTGTLAERYLRQTIHRIRRRTGRRTRYDMNPYALWLKENPKLNTFVTDTLQADLAALDELDEGTRSILTRHAAGRPTPQSFKLLTATWALRRLLEL